jgi:hypothetical protein
MTLFLQQNGEVLVSHTFKVICILIAKDIYTVPLDYGSHTMFISDDRSTLYT